MKKILLTSLEHNHITVKSWADLWFWQLKKDLEAYLEKEVDILRWSAIRDPAKLNETYERAILAVPIPAYAQYLEPGKVRSEAFITLNKLTCIRSYINFGIDASGSYESAEQRIIESFKKDDLSEKVHNFCRSKSNIVFGNDIALTLWDEDTYVYLTETFDFATVQKYKNAKVFYDSFNYRSRFEMETVIRNVAGKIVQIYADKAEFVLPVIYENYGGDFLHYVALTCSTLNIPMCRFISNFRNQPWRRGIWNPITDEKHITPPVIPYLQ